MAVGLDEMLDEFLEAMKEDLGKDKFVGQLAEVNAAKGSIMHDVKHLDEWVKETSVDTPILIAPGRSFIKPEPLGVVLYLSAWNYPVNLTIAPVAQAIAAGNCVVVKPSELSPRVAKVLQKYFDRYADKRFVRCVNGAAKTCIKLTSLRFDAFGFTGSTQKGKLVAAAAAKNLIPCLLELGGKSPAIVDENANLNMAVKKILMGKLPNAG